MFWGKTVTFSIDPQAAFILRRAGSQLKAPGLPVPSQGLHSMAVWLSEELNATLKKKKMKSVS